MNPRAWWWGVFFAIILWAIILFVMSLAFHY